MACVSTKRLRSDSFGEIHEAYAGKKSCTGEGMQDFGADPQWIQPFKLEVSEDPNCRDLPLSKEVVSSWARRGFALVDDLLPQELVDRCRYECFGVEGRANASVSVGGFGAFVFPSDLHVVNEISLHPRLIAAAVQLLGTEDVRLSQADIHRKQSKDPPWGYFDNQDQRVHMDYPNHTLVHPPPWSQPEAVAMIIYMDAVEDCGGATAIVPREGPDDEVYQFPFNRTPGTADLPWINNREKAEAHLQATRPEVAHFRKQLYRRELQCCFRKGTVLLYRHDTWHRGTPLKRGASRVAMNLVYKRSGLEWFTCWQYGWARSIYYVGGAHVQEPGKPQFSTFAKLLAMCSVQQRSCLGFPLPGHPYWTEETLAAVKARFGPLGFDDKPYAEALRKRERDAAEHANLDAKALHLEVLTLRAEVERLRGLL